MPSESVAEALNSLPVHTASTLALMGLPVPIETREALYRIVVRIDDAAVNGYGRKWALAPGMRLAADMILDERNLWEWLLDPLIAAKRRSES